jgi:glutamate--cysteine ligase
MGPLGYQSEAQASLRVSYNSLETYARALENALTESHAAYEAIGVRDGDGYRQLGTSVLQIENEFYGTIRPKCTPRPGERPLQALRARGVEYVEVRTIDLDPFCAVGIEADTIRFLDVFLLHCLLDESPLDTVEEMAAIARNQLRVSELGRDPGLMLERRGHHVELSAWALQVLDECEPIAAALDAHAGGGHAQALSAAIACLRDPAMLPSARMLRTIEQEHEGSYAGFVLARSARHARELAGMRLPDAVGRRYARMAQRSLAEQRKIEAADVLSFEEFRRDYVSRQI